MKLTVNAAGLKAKGNGPLLNMLSVDRGSLADSGHVVVDVPPLNSIHALAALKACEIEFTEGEPAPEPTPEPEPAPAPAAPDPAPTPAPAAPAPARNTKKKVKKAVKKKSTKKKSTR